MLSHGKLDLSYFFWRGRKLCGFAAHISGRNRRGNNLPRDLEKYVCLFTDTFTYASNCFRK